MKKTRIAITAVVFGVASAAQAGFSSFPTGFDVVVANEDGQIWSASNNPGSINNVDRTGGVTSISGEWTQSEDFSGNWDVAFSSSNSLTVDSVFSFTNRSTNSQSLTIDFSAEMPAVSAPSTIDGSVSGSISGGTVSSNGSLPYYEAFIEGTSEEMLYGPAPTFTAPPGDTVEIPLVSFSRTGGPAANGISVTNAFTLSPGATVEFDNFFELVPTPGTAAILGLSSLTVLRRRRER